MESYYHRLEMGFQGSKEANDLLAGLNREFPGQVE
jgi:hypothetical protein